MHPPSECQLKQPLNTQYSYVETRNAGIYCPFLTSRNGFPGRCAINTETSAVKHLRVRRQRWTDTVPSRAWQRCSFFIGRSPLEKGPICHPRAQRAANSGLTLGRVCSGVAVSVPLDGRTRNFPNTAVADKQCTGLQNPRMWARYPPAVPFFMEHMPHARHDRGSPRHRLGAVGRVSACAPWSHFQKAGRASALSGFICPTWLVRLQPLQPFQGPLAQSARALACRAKGSGSKARTDRHFPRARSDRRSTAVLPLLRLSQVCSAPHDDALSRFSAAHSRRRSVTVRVHPFRILGDLTVGCRSVKAAALVRTQPEEPIQARKV